MTVCDPLYGYMSFDADERRLIDHRAFQRLRSIQQLGFSQYAFPSGSGNRFSHSLGACHLAGLAFDSVFSKKEAPRLSGEKRRLFRKTLRFAALLHDIGHGPLSHSSECLTPPLSDLGLEGFFAKNSPQEAGKGSRAPLSRASPEGTRPVEPRPVADLPAKALRRPSGRRARHEDYSALLILKTDLAGLIQKAGVEPEAVVSLIHRELFWKTADFWKERDLCFQPFLGQIISSDLDVDRMDYLQRDSLFCGVKYGLMDFQWLLSHFTCHREGDRLFLALRREALYTVESFLLGRQHMRLIVYFHRKAVVYNQMLQKYAQKCARRRIPPAQWTLPADPESYIRFTDSRLFETLKETENEWSRRILGRKKPFLRLFERTITSPRRRKEAKEAEREKDLKQALQKTGIPFIEADSNQSAPAALPAEGFSANRFSAAKRRPASAEAWTAKDFSEEAVPSGGISAGADGAAAAEAAEPRPATDRSAMDRTLEARFTADRIFLKDSLTARAEPLNDSLLPLPERRIRRIYVAPEFFEEAKKKAKRIFIPV